MEVSMLRLLHVITINTIFAQQICISNTECDHNGKAIYLVFFTSICVPYLSKTTQNCWSKALSRWRLWRSRLSTCTFHFLMLLSRDVSFHLRWKALTVCTIQVTLCVQYRWHCVDNTGDIVKEYLWGYKNTTGSSGHFIGGSHSHNKVQNGLF